MIRALRYWFRGKTREIENVPESIADWWLRTSICAPYLSGIDERSIEEVRRRRAAWADRRRADDE